MRKVYLGVLTVTVVILAFAFLTFTQFREAKPLIHCRVVVTLNYGRKLLVDREVPLNEGSSAMDALKLVAEVETRYGGGFVYSINGIKSGYSGRERIKMDWFFYVNGFLANEGASSYRVKNGDLTQWDYHYWGFQMFNKAIVGAFPETFSRGYGGKVYPTIIAYEEGFENDAKRLGLKLEEFSVKVKLRGLDELNREELENSNVILISTLKPKIASELNREHARIGFYLYFNGNAFVEVSSRGEVLNAYRGHVGVIQAAQNVWNPKGDWACENVIWVVWGLDSEGVKSAVNAILQENFRYAFSILILNGTVVREPK